MRYHRHYNTNERRGFLTREAAEDYQMQSSTTPAYCPVMLWNDIAMDQCRRFCGDIQVTDYNTRAGGRVHVWAYQAKSRKGDIRTYYGSYIGS